MVIALIWMKVTIRMMSHHRRHVVVAQHCAW
jgi:hypothetical protein